MSVIRKKLYVGLVVTLLLVAGFGFVLGDAQWTVLSDRQVARLLSPELATVSSPDPAAVKRWDELVGQVAQKGVPLSLRITKLDRLVREGRLERREERQDTHTDELLQDILAMEGKELLQTAKEGATTEAIDRLKRIWVIENAIPYSELTGVGKWSPSIHKERVIDAAMGLVSLLKSAETRHLLNFIDSVPPDTRQEDRLKQMFWRRVRPLISDPKSGARKLEPTVPPERTLGSAFYLSTPGPVRFVCGHFDASATTKLVGDFYQEEIDNCRRITPKSSGKARSVIMDRFSSLPKMPNFGKLSWQQSAANSVWRLKMNRIPNSFGFVMAEHFVVGKEGIPAAIWDRQRTLVEVLKTRLAARLYVERHHRIPASLSELVGPGLLESEPIDFMSETKLHYDAIKGMLWSDGRYKNTYEPFYRTFLTSTRTMWKIR